mmetsp:Transcript_32418/g.82278  ORF Transcript_32418/g.82278 Transcript_32418/m.82278 type:complete len:185 (-) Transcript_32418:282-836(-)
MHIDRLESHILSSILHIGHEGADWPLVIEDFQGITHELFLEPGDMLFYESSKIMHRRPRRFEGSWYSSMFLHYQPVGWDLATIAMDTTYRIPPDWDVTKPEEGLDELYTEIGRFFEPGCVDLWCGLKHAEQWRGPAGLAQLGKAVCTGSASRSGTTTADRVDDTLTPGHMDHDAGAPTGGAGEL